MKTLLLSLSILICSAGWSQIPISNKTPFTAMDLCYPGDSVTINSLFNFTQHFDVTGTPACQGGETKLYYSFLNTIPYPMNDRIFGIDFTGSYDYKLFGPFSDLTSGAMLVNSGAANVYSSGTATGQHLDSSIINVGDIFILEVVVDDCEGDIILLGGRYKRRCAGATLSECDDCLPSFTPGEKTFVLSAWVSEGTAPNTKTTFSQPAIEITVNGYSTTHTFHPAGQVIDGWQRIEGTFPSASNGDITLKFIAGNESTYFDDIRIFPSDGSMMSYVYDPVTLRLVAELDERNYAKFYEYDEEGKLIRVKKETVEGIMTLQENRENSFLKPAE